MTAPAWTGHPPPMLRASLREAQPRGGALPFPPLTTPPPPPLPPPALCPDPGAEDRTAPLALAPEDDSDEVPSGGQTLAFQRPIRGPATRVSPARLRVELGPGIGQTLDLPPAGGSVGRGSDNDLQLRSPQVSRHHARFVRLAGDVFIEDLQGGNGVLLNQVRVHRAMLFDGDLIQLGDVMLRFERG